MLWLRLSFSVFEATPDGGKAAANATNSTAYKELEQELAAVIKHKKEIEFNCR